MEDVRDISPHVVETRLTHEASGVGLVGADLAVNLNKALLKDSSDLLASKSVLEAVAEEDGQRQRLAELVGTRRGAGGLGTLVLPATMFGRSCSRRCRPACRASMTKELRDA